MACPLHRFDHSCPQLLERKVTNSLVNGHEVGPGRDRRRGLGHNRPQPTTAAIALDCGAHLTGHCKRDPPGLFGARSRKKLYPHRSREDPPLRAAQLGESATAMDRSWARRTSLFAKNWQLTAHCRRESRGCRAATQADSRTRPRRRRALMTARPARVAILWRKPCLLDLLRVLGWNVRFISASFRRSGAARLWCLPTRRWPSGAGAIDPPR